MKAIWSKNFIIPALAIAAVYVTAAIYLMNADLVKYALLEMDQFGSKLALLLSLLGGMWTIMSGFNLFLLIATAILTGANLTLVIQRLRIIRSSGKIGLMVGGGSLLGIVGSGCVSCGLPILALLGLAGAIGYLPFRGIELSVAALGLLILSFYLLIKSWAQGQGCVIYENR